ncbi:hypothetical protein JCM3766R1_004373 [Sporobolomyces carnicolor]
MPKKKDGVVDNSSLSSIVSHLVRSQIGSTAAASLSDPTTTTAAANDAELDRQVAELLLKEARAASSNYDAVGTRAFYDPAKEQTRHLRKPNTRFLGNVLRNVGDHNEHLRRVELEQHRRRERDEARLAEEWRHDHAHNRDRDRPSRDDPKGKQRVNDDDDADGERRRKRRRRELGLEECDDDRGSSSSTRPLARFCDETQDTPARERGGAGSGDAASRRRRDGDDGTSRDRSRRCERRDHNSDAARRRSASPSREADLTDDDAKDRTERRRRRRRETDDEDEQGRAGRDRRDRTEPEREDGRERHGGGGEGGGRERPRNRDRHREERGHASGRDDGRRDRRKRSPTPEKRKDMRDESSPVAADRSSRRVENAREDPVQPVSKMDKYFSPTYDPLLDFTPAQLALGRTGSGSAGDDDEYGLIGEGSFNAWDQMLDSIKGRKEEKKLREAREKEERRKERERKRKERRRKKGEAVSSSDGDDGGGRDRRDGSARGLMEMKYSKKGGTREWDLGKETPT